VKRFAIGLVLAVMAWWLFDRLWPAIRSEPSTWLGENWREQIRDRAGV